MKRLVIDLPVMMAIVATRAALAFGVGLLVANKLSDRRRRRIALTLVGIGAATTIPAAMFAIRAVRRSDREASDRALAAAGVSRDERLIGAQRFPRKGDEE